MKPKAAVASAIILFPLTLLGATVVDTNRPTPPSAEGSREKAVDTEVSSGGAVEAGEDQILLPALRGLVIASDSETATKQQRLAREGVEIIGFTEKESAAIRKIAGETLGKPVSLRSLGKLTSKLDAEFRAQGRTFLRISFPPQEITTGVVAIRICPARAGQVLLAGNMSFGKAFAASGFRTRAGEMIQTDKVLDDLDWLNENTLRRASISYADGANDDELDLTLRVRATKTWRVYAGIDDQLSQDLGNERIFVGFQHGDMFGLDHRFTGQYTSALEFDRLQGVSGVYEIPLPIRHILEMSAGYTHSRSDGVSQLDQSGDFSHVGLVYHIPLPRWKLIGQECRIGMEFSDSAYRFPDDSSQSVKSFQIETGWNGTRTDRYGTTTLDASLLYNPGRGILGSDDEDYQSLGASGAESWIAKLEAERTFKLGEFGVLSARLSAQIANSRLQSSDQITAGGEAGVRGFDESVGYASDGMVGGIEFQSPVYHAPVIGDFIGVAFFDGALLSKDLPIDTGELASVGVGLKWRFDDHLSAKLDLGIPIVFPDREKGTPLLHFAVSSTW